MRELDNVDMTANLLLKHSDIVTTIRRVNVSARLAIHSFHADTDTVMTILLWILMTWMLVLRRLKTRCLKVQGLRLGVEPFSIGLGVEAEGLGLERLSLQFKPVSICARYPLTAMLYSLVQLCWKLLEFRFIFCCWFVLLLRHVWWWSFWCWQQISVCVRYT